MCCRLLLAASITALSAAWAAPAQAQDAATQTAKAHFDRGQQLYLQAKFTEAAAAFLKAYQTKPFPAFLFNVAVCHEKNKDYAKAMKYYEMFIKKDPHSGDHGLVKKRIAAIRKHLNPPTTRTTTQPITPQLPSLPPIETKGVVVIESNPEGAAIYLNDRRRIFTRTPYTGSLPPGRHTVIIELKEFKPVQKTITVRKDVLTYLHFSLARARNLGWIEIRGNIPGAQVYFDKKEFGAVGTTPFSRHLRPGKRRIIIEKPGFEPYIRPVTVIAGKTHTIAYKLKRVSYGWLKVTGHTTKGARVLVDGKPFDCGDEPYPCRNRLDKGHHTVVLKREGFKPYKTTINVGTAQEVQVAVRLNPKPSRIKAYVTLGVAAAILGGAIASGVISLNRKNSLEDDLENGVIFDTGDKRATEGKITAIVADSLFALSGIVAALGVYYLFRKVGPESYGQTRTRKIAITPLVGPQVAGVGGQMRF